MQKPLLAASLMCMDLLRVAEQIDVMNRQLDMYHIDVMDGHYCKNISLSPDFANAVKKIAALPIDVHLMVTSPNDFIDKLHLDENDCISVHAETINTDAFRTLNAIKDKGCKCGVVLNPATSLDSVKSYLNRIDILTIMTVDVGYAGQKFIDEMRGKIMEARELRERFGYKYVIQVDGSCNERTFKILHAAGAEIYILGSSGLFSKSRDIDTACKIAKSAFSKTTGVIL